MNLPDRFNVQHKATESFAVKEYMLTRVSGGYDIAWEGKLTKDPMIYSAKDVHRFIEEGTWIVQYVCVCASCEAPVFELDYLCAEHRRESES